jgi:putative FmdB family regulatory protein
MPSYEYRCRTCDRTFEIRLSVQDHDAGRARCPHCQGQEVEQVMTSFVAMTSKKS